jgi:hypothetical protein
MGTAVDAESLTVPAGTFAALKPQSADTFTQANGTTLVITGTDGIDVAMLAFPLFSGRLSLVICGTRPDGRTPQAPEAHRNMKCRIGRRLGRF